jgi:peptidoglycan/LPS O-acetylase OafA/YrhL
LARAHFYTSKEEITSHTALRGFGAIAVMYVHFSYAYDAAGQRYYIEKLFPNFGVLLEIFFVLSGFIISYIYAEKFADRTRYDTFVKFIWARFSRLYPVHILTLALYVGTVAIKYVSPALAGMQTAPFFDEQNNAYTLLTNILIIHAWGLHHQLSWNYLSWAVSAEFAAYLVFPILCLIIGHGRWIGTLALIAAAFTGYFIFNHIYGDLNVPGYNGAVRCICGFSLGVALYTLSPLMKRVPLSGIHLLQLLSAAAVVWGFAAADNQILIIVAIAALVLATSENRGWLHPILLWGPFQSIGYMSFTIYMVHAVAGRALKPVAVYIPQLLNIGVTGWFPIVEMLVKMAFAVAVAYPVYRYFELPMRNRLSHPPQRLMKVLRVAP